MIVHYVIEVCLAGDWFDGGCCLNCLFCSIDALRFRFSCLFGWWLIWVVILDLFLIVGVLDVLVVGMNVAVYFVLVLVCTIVYFTVLIDLFVWRLIDL